MPPSKDALRWGVDDVAEYLIGEEVEDEVVMDFMSRGINGPAFLALDDATLVKLGIKKVVRLGLLQLVQRLSSSQKSKPSKQPQQGGEDDAFQNGEHACGGERQLGREEEEKIIPRHQEDDQAEDGELSGGAKVPEPTEALAKIGACADHTSPCGKFCQLCRVLVCERCVGAGGKHLGHALVSLSQHSQNLRGQLEEVVETLGKQSVHIEKVLLECGQGLEKLAQTTAGSIRQILATKEKLNKALELATEKAVKAIQGFEQVKKNYLQNTIEKNMFLKKEIDELRRDLEQHIHESNDELVLQQQDHLIEVCNELLGEHKARDIATLEPILGVGARVDEEGTVKKLLEIIGSFLFSVHERGGPVISVGIKPLGRQAQVMDIPQGPALNVVLYGSDHSLYLFDHGLNAWKTLGQDAQKRNFGPAIGYSQGKVYVAGGDDHKDVLNSFAVFEIATKVWYPMPPMHFRRRYTCGVFLADGVSFMVSGGDDSHQNLASCEVFNPLINEWTDVPPLPSPVRSHGFVLYKNRPLVLGGFHQMYLASCHSFDLDSNKWTAFPSFSHGRYEFGVAVLDDKIYIAGGWGNEGPSASLEMFDGTRWMVLPALLSRPRNNVTALPVGDKIVVLSTQNIEVYDPATGVVQADVFPKLPGIYGGTRFPAVSFS